MHTDAEPSPLSSSIFKPKNFALWLGRGYGIPCFEVASQFSTKGIGNKATGR